MRPIRFRAWDSSKGVMSEPFELGSQDSEYAWDEVMQFTGLVDKNGVEIFEGDIIDGWVVTYSGDQNEGLGMYVGWYLQRDNFESWTELESRSNDNGDNYEVIGNIYANPELL